MENSHIEEVDESMENTFLQNNTVNSFIESISHIKNYNKP